MALLGGLGGLGGVGGLGGLPALGGGLGTLGQQPPASVGLQGLGASLGGLGGGLAGLGGGLGGLSVSTGLGLGGLGAVPAIQTSAPLQLGAGLLGGVSTGLTGLGGLGTSTGLGLGALPALQTSAPLQLGGGLLPGLGSSLATSMPMTSMGLLGLGQQPGIAGAAAAGGRDKQTDLIMRADTLARNVSMRGMDGGPIAAVMDKLRAYYKPNPVDYKFKAVTHAIREPGATYTQPPLLTAEEWATEQRLHAYDDACSPRQALVPLVLDGFTDLSERLNWQARSIEQLNKATESLLSLVKTAESGTKRHYDRLEAVRVHHMQLTERMLRVAQKVDAVVARQTVFSKDEAALLRVLEEILQYLKQSANLRARIDTLLLRQRMREEAVTLTSTDAALDGESMRRVAKQLTNHKRGIEQLLNILRKDARDLQIMETHRISTEPAGGADGMVM